MAWHGMAWHGMAWKLNLPTKQPVDLQDVESSNSTVPRMELKVLAASLIAQATPPPDAVAGLLQILIRV